MKKITALIGLVAAFMLTITMSACSAGKGEIAENAVREFFLTDVDDIVEKYEERFAEMQNDSDEPDVLSIEQSQFILNELNEDYDAHFSDAGADYICQNYGLYQYYAALHEVEVDTVNVSVVEVDENNYDFEADFRYNGESYNYTGRIQFKDGLIQRMRFDHFDVSVFA